MGEQRLSEGYRARTAHMAESFPAAFAFLSRFEAEEGTDRLWLSTAMNAHLYKGNVFLAYLKLDTELPSLIVSPRFNRRIVADTSDGSRHLFPRPFDDVLVAHGGLAAGWAVQEGDGSTTLGVATPTAFFDQLFGVLVALDAHGPAPGERSAAVQRWEYHRLALREPGSFQTWEEWGGDEAVARLGREGWELVSTTRTTEPAEEPLRARDCLMLLFKRRAD